MKRLDENFEFDISPGDGATSPKLWFSMRSVVARFAGDPGDEVWTTQQLNEDYLEQLIVRLDESLRDLRRHNEV